MRSVHLQGLEAGKWIFQIVNQVIEKTYSVFFPRLFSVITSISAYNADKNGIFKEAPVAKFNSFDLRNLNLLDERTDREKVILI